MRVLLLVATVWIALVPASHAAPKQVRLFVALCDNKSQGIIPVGAKIGNGDDPYANLYWGCSDGFGTFFRRSPRWKVIKNESDLSEVVLRRSTVRHTSGDVEIVADAYRGTAMATCIRDFESAAASGKFDLVAFIGHNGLMDTEIPAPTAAAGNKTPVIVLCCLSDRYFSARLRRVGCDPLLMTKQLMYPGSFLLDAAIESWRKGGGPADIKAAAAWAYAQNQKISVRAASTIFADVGKSATTPD